VGGGGGVLGGEVKGGCGIVLLAEDGGLTRRRGKSFREMGVGGGWCVGVGGGASGASS